MTGNQIKAARSLLGWTQARVAEASGVSIPTVKRAEGSGALSASPNAIAEICKALEDAGVVFIQENGGSIGVRLK
ncbi:helix-turn-helix domain-containing protein [Pseudooceanicola spongiae]|nr:helix-turn-helix domain-containing protein [Pseudooceanicola spongiae]